MMINDANTVKYVNTIKIIFKRTLFIQKYLFIINPDRTKFLISFGDCAVTANVPGMRNMMGHDNADLVLRRSYLELGDITPQLPNAPGIVPELLERVFPVHEVVKVDLFLPGCPPSADRIKAAIAPLLEGKMPLMEGRDMIKFG